MCRPLVCVCDVHVGLVQYVDGMCALYVLSDPCAVYGVVLYRRLLHILCCKDDVL